MTVDATLAGRTRPGQRIVELGADECWELLGGEAVGRVVYADDQGPLAVPVNFAVQDGTLLFRTSPASSLARHLRETPTCAFEVDRIDTRLRSGWSVLARGSAALVRHPGMGFDAEVTTPWPGGTRFFLIRITPSELTGRRLLAP
jgi:nitroimidazol reductase NimA-like FMN-containing flavoprotein (pyridoxamine 5'-phosphate oxidase superfamily)